jgi:hypothetical protein
MQTIFLHVVLIHEHFASTSNAKNVTTVEMQLMQGLYSKMPHIPKIMNSQNYP